jgi:hypothetical protein
MVAFFITGILVFCQFCRDNPEEIVTVTGNNTRPIEELKRLVLLKGDKKAFDELMIAYFNEQYTGEYLFYALFMANKYNYPQAYFDVYQELENLESPYGRSIYEKDTRGFMLEYLKKGAYLGHGQSKYELGNLYMEGKYLPKDTVLGKELMAGFSF